MHAHTLVGLDPRFGGGGGGPCTRRHGTADGVHVIRGTFAPGSQPDGNSVILTAPEGLIVVDTGRHAAHTQAILDFAKGTGRPIAAVVNTHWHLDHIGGNALIRREYPAVRIHASGALQGALTGFLANYRTQLAAMVADPATDAATKKSFQTEIALIDAGVKLAPDVVVSSSGATTIAGRALHVGLETQSVTAGDVWVLDEKSGVLIAGDLVTLPAPFLDTACPARWQESLDRLAGLEFDLLVPGHGAPMTRTQFASYRRAYRELLACAAKTDAPKEQCIDGWTGTLGPLLSGFDDRFTRSLMEYYVDLLRGDPAKIAAACAPPATADRETDARELLALHEEVLRAHLASDIDRLLAGAVQEFVVANRGSISRPTIEQRRNALGPYLQQTRFSLYRDKVPPIVKVSGDGSLGWVIAQVEARGVQSTDSGTSEPLEFVSAWIELYEKRDGRWRSIGNVSNFKE